MTARNNTPIMYRAGIITWISFFVLMININAMNAQRNKNTKSALRKISNTASFQQKKIMIRISEIEIFPEYNREYKTILKEEAEASVRLEPGVLAIFPMYQEEDTTQIRILEIYADKEAYQAHLKTPHFQKYKTTTLKMVKSLKLIDMVAIDQEMMPGIFRKLKIEK